VPPSTDLWHGCHVALDVLHLLPTNQRRGAETFGYELHGALSSRGRLSEIYCLEPAPSGRQLPVPVLGERRFTVSGTQALRRLARQARVVVAHGSNTLAASAVGLTGIDVPFIYVNIGDPRFWAASPSRRLRVGWMLRRAVAIAAISPGARDMLADHFRLDTHRLRVMPNGRAGDRFTPADQPARNAARRSLSLPDDAGVIGVIGALGREKRVDVAIRALARLPHLLLLVAGDGPERTSLESLADRAAPGRVVFLGTVEDARTVLAAADVLTLSSDSEGVPGVLIEAGLSGLPVVATDVGWVRDVVREGETGLLVPPRRPDLLATALVQALARREALGQAARAHCLAHFEMGTITDRWEALLDEVARPKQTSTAATD